MKKKTYKKVGRPTVFTEETVLKLEQGFKIGLNDTECIAYADVSRNAFYDFLRKNPEFNDKKDKWKLNPIAKAKNTIFKHLDDPKTAQWFLERKCKQEFSTAQEILNTNANLEITNEKVIEKVMNKLKEL